jgi:tetratricopeptide (TPR) repeat protein
MKRITVPLVAGSMALVVTLAAGHSLAPLDVRRSDETHLLYLPNGKHLKVASLGQAPLVADLVYLWAIQYYANYDGPDRYRYVEHIFRNVIAELDPHYIDAYWLGALIMTLEGHDLEAGLRLLDDGIANNPDEWVLPYIAAWECHFAGEFNRAADYFRIAAEVPGAPPQVRRAIGGMMKRAGNIRGALAEWMAILEDPSTDELSRTIATRQVRDLKFKADVADLQIAIAAFRRDNDHSPESLEQLVRSGYIRMVPLDPDLEPYSYDPVTGAVTSSAGRVLGDR